MNKIVVEIMGRTYTIISDETEDTVKKIASFVDEKYNKLKIGLPAISSEKLAILGSLEIAGELFKTRNEYENRAVKLIETIDSAIKNIN